MAEVAIKIKATDQGSGAIKSVGDRVDGLNSHIKGASASWQKYTLAAGAAIGVLAGVGAAAGKAMQLLGEGAALELAASRFDNLAASIDTTADALTGQMATATSGMVSQAQLVASASDMISLGLADSGDEVVRLSNLVGQLGWDMNVLTLTLANDSMLRLDALGLSMENVKGKMEELKASNVAADEAFDLAVIEAGEEKLALLGSAAGTTAGQIQQLTVVWQNAADAFKQEFAGGVADQLGIVAGAAREMGPAVQEGMGQWGSDIGGWLGNLIAGAASEGLQRQTDALNDDLRDMGVSASELRDLERSSTAGPLPFIYDAQEGIKYYTDLKAALEETYAVLLMFRNDPTAADWADAQWAAQIATDAQTEAARRQQAQMAVSQSTYVGITDQYWEMGQAQGALYGSFEYGQYVIEHQAAAVENLAARTEAYQLKLERLWETQAAGGDFFMQQAGAEAGDRIFGSDMTANADALNQMILGIADNAGVGAIGLADLNVQLGEMEPNAARAMVAATVAQQATELLVNAWQGGTIDTSQLMGSIDAVIAELQNKTLPEIEIGIKAKIDMGEGLDIPQGERRWMEMMGESPEIPIEANLAPFEAALATALGQVTGAPTDGRTLQILADYEAVTTAATTDIPAAIQSIPADARTIEFIANDQAVQDTITAIDQKRLTVFVDYVSTNAPEIPGRAAGGPVSGSTPYWVGEQGPELFVPWTSGSIVPNHRIGAGGAGGDFSVTLNFYGQTNAADVRQAVDSAGRRLLEKVRQSGVPI